MIRRGLMLKLGLPVAAVIAVLSVLGLLLAGATYGGNPTEPGCGQVGLIVGTGAIGYPMRPGSYRISSGFGPRGGGFHYGLDLAAPDDTPIYAAAGGMVAEAGPASGFGLWIVVDHAIGGQRVSTVYGHMNAGGLLVSAGDTVTAGQLIARSGHNGESTGPHLHFEVWPGGRLSGGRAVDPLGWLNANAAGTADPTPGIDPVTQVGELLPAPVTGQVFMSVDDAQRGNAATIVGVVKGAGLPLRVAVLAVAAAMQESLLRNIDYGDRDSLGLFQQRPSQGWGTREQILDPVHATGRFLDALTAVPGYLTMPLTAAIQAAQHSGFPLAYAKWETQAAQLVAAAAGVDPITAGLGPVFCGALAAAPTSPAAGSMAGSDPHRP